MLKLKNSGYHEKFRMQILDSCMKAYQKMVEDDKNGVKPMYRSRDWNIEESQRKKSDKKLSWWNSQKAKNQYTSVLFVTPTQGVPWQRSLGKERKNSTKIARK